MATRKTKTAPAAPAPEKSEECKHQWVTVMGDDPYHLKKVCVKCGKEGEHNAE